MSMVPNGVPFHGEFSSADASALSEANSRLALYGAGGVSALTLNANDFVSITDVTISTGAALTVQVYDGANNAVGAGEQVCIAKINGAIAIPFTVAHTCQKGTYPKVITSGAGQVDVTIRGTIIRQGA